MNRTAPATTPTGACAPADAEGPAYNSHPALSAASTSEGDPDGSKLADYQEQLLLLEQRSEKRKAQVNEYVHFDHLAQFGEPSSASPEDPDGSKLADYQEQLLRLERQSKKRKALLDRHLDFEVPAQLQGSSSKDYGHIDDECLRHEATTDPGNE